MYGFYIKFSLDDFYTKPKLNQIKTDTYFEVNQSGVKTKPAAGSRRGRRLIGQDNDDSFQSIREHRNAKLRIRNISFQLNLSFLSSQLFSYVLLQVR